MNRCLSHNIFLLGVCPMHLKKHVYTNYSLLLPLLVLFCSFLFFHTLSTVRARKFCPAALWNRPFHSLPRNPLFLERSGAQIALSRVSWHFFPAVYRLFKIPFLFIPKMVSLHNFSKSKWLQTPSLLGVFSCGLVSILFSGHLLSIY